MRYRPQKSATNYQAQLGLPSKAYSIKGLVFLQWLVDVSDLGPYIVINRKHRKRTPGTLACSPLVSGLTNFGDPY